MAKLGKRERDAILASNDDSLTNEPLCGARWPKGRERAQGFKDDFKSAPKGSRHQRMLWAACKVARLTGVTEGGAYQMLLSALIEAEERGPIPGFSMTADE
jgi:hypothetical protein